MVKAAIVKVTMVKVTLVEVNMVKVTMVKVGMVKVAMVGFTMVWVTMVEVTMVMGLRVIMSGYGFVKGSNEWSEWLRVVMGWLRVTGAESESNVMLGMGCSYFPFSFL